MARAGVEPAFERGAPLQEGGERERGEDGEGGFHCGMMLLWFGVLVAAPADFAGGLILASTLQLEKANAMVKNAKARTGSAKHEDDFFARGFIVLKI